nr:hypothetical protein CFP56_58353 [Quercus suber]
MSFKSLCCVVYAPISLARISRVISKEWLKYEISMGTQFSSLTNMASGNPVQLTDEHGHPMDLTGVATTKIHDEPDRETTGGTFASTCVGVDGAKEHDQ